MCVIHIKVPTYFVYYIIIYNNIILNMYIILYSIEWIPQKMLQMKTYKSKFMKNKTFPNVFSLLKCTFKYIFH